MDKSRRLHFIQLFSVFLIATLARMVLGRAINGPAIFTDEYQYIEMARSLPLGKGLMWDGVPTDFPCWFYPLLIAPFVNLLSWDYAYLSIRGLGAILMALAAFPAYGLARELTPHRRALAAAILVALIPAAGYSPAIMTESLFLPFFTLAVWAIWRAVLRPTPWRRLAAGLACGVAFHIKPHAMLLPLALAATVIIFEADRLRGQGLAPRAWLGRYLAGVGRHWLTALGWALAVSPRLFEILHYEHHPITPGRIMGSYTGLAEGRHAASPHALALSLAGYGVVWLWCVGLLPAWTLLRQLGASIRRREEAAGRLLVILTVVVTAFMLILVGRHTLVINDDWRVHERYIFVVLPLALVLFCVRGQALTRGGSLFALLAFAGIIPFHVWILKKITWTLPTSAPSFTGLLFFHRPQWAAWGWLIALYALPAALAVLLLLWGALAWRPVRFRTSFAIVAFLYLSGNIGWYGVNGSLLSPSHVDDLNTARDVERAMDGKGCLLVLRDGMRRNLCWRAGIRNPGLGVALDPYHHAWWETTLDVPADGLVRPPQAQTEAWLLAANIWKFNRAPDAAFADTGLYHLSATDPLRLAPDQLLAYRRNLLTTATLAGGGSFLALLRLSVLEKHLPAAWTANTCTSLSLRLRNDSQFALPGGTIHLGLTSVWIAPAALGRDDAVTTGERITFLPGWVAPGGQVTHSMQLRVPPAPGKGYLLSIKPFVYVGSVDRRPGIDPRRMNFFLDQSILVEKVSVLPAAGAAGGS